MIHKVFWCAALSLCVSAAENGLVFRASFNDGLAADVAGGDRHLYWSPKMEVPPKISAVGLPPSGVVTHKKPAGYPAAI